MSDMKCPFCGEKLQQTYSFNPKQFWCSNYYDHKHPINLQGTKELWQALITTRKQLDVAVDILKIMNDGLPNGNRWKWEIEKALEQITTLKQKDVK